MTNLRVGFAGDRDISVWVLDYLLSQGIQPLVLLVSSPKRSSHDDELIARCPFIGAENILRGKAFREPPGMRLLEDIGLDLLIGVHFPYVAPPEVLALPKIGVMNLHPAYLPFNRGWHTPSWAILENTPIGATLHFMDAGVDTGDIVYQKRLDVRPNDTANTLYQRLKQLELETFKEAWPSIADGTYVRQIQNPAEGTQHTKNELFDKAIQEIQLEEEMTVGQMLRRLRALTTNQIGEAAYFEVDGKRYRVQVHIQEESS